MRTLIIALAIAWALFTLYAVYRFDQGQHPCQPIPEATLRRVLTDILTNPADQPQPY